MNNSVPDRKITVACSSCGRLNRIHLARAGDQPICGHCGTPIPVDRPLAATDGNLSRIINDSDIPVLVDFYADWCGPCQTMAPLLDEVAKSRSAETLVLKLDTDRNPRTAEQFQIRGIPTLILFESGREARRQVGAVSRQALEQMLDR